MDLVERGVVDGRKVRGVGVAPLYNCIKLLASAENPVGGYFICVLLDYRISAGVKKYSCLLLIFKDTSS